MQVYFFDVCMIRLYDAVCKITKVAAAPEVDITAYTVPSVD